MNPLDRARFGALYKRPRMQRLIDQSLAIIRNAFETVEGPAYLAVSGGKDSLVTGELLKLAGYGGDKIDYWWGDDGWDYDETLPYLDTLASYWDVEIKRFDSIGIKAKGAREIGHFYASGNEIEHAAAGHSLSRDMSLVHGYDMVFIGLRKEESRVRRITLGKHGTLYYAENDSIWKCQPVADWLTEDIWAFIIGANTPYNSAYDKLEELGIPLKYRRVGPLTATAVYQFGMISALKRGWPELYNRFAKEVPEIARYT